MKAGSLAVLRGCGRSGWILAALGAAMLMWTAVVDGRPAVFSDTALYYGQAEYLFEALHLVSPSQAVEPPGDPTALPSRPGLPNVSAEIDGARSPLYGGFVYLLQRAASLWLVAFVQAWAAAGAVYLLYRAAAPAAPRWGYLALMAGLAVLTPLPFFASWIMPDLFAGVAGCGLILLLVYPDRLGCRRLMGSALLTGFSLAVHRSNLLDAAAVAVAAAGLLRLGGLTWGQAARRVALVGAVAVATVLAGALVYLPISAKAGQPIGTPPFMSARVLADGPGLAYLRRTCTGPGTPFTLCAFRDRPMLTSDQVLWSSRRKTAVFLGADTPTRLRMERDDARFALAETLADPWDQARASAWDAAQQFAMAYVDDPLKAQGFYVSDRFWRATVLPRILPGAARCRGPASCRPHVGKSVCWGLEGVGLTLSLLLLAGRLSAGDLRAMLAGRAETDWRDDRVRLLTALGLALVLLAANAVICGVLSGPFPRYQARLIWLIPLMAGLVIARLGWRRRSVGPGGQPRHRLKSDTPPLDAPKSPR